MLRAVATGDCGADLTQPTCWQMSNGVLYPHSPENGRDWEEAGAIATQDGIAAMVRLDSPLMPGVCTSLQDCNRAALLKYDTATTTLSYDRDVPLPTGCNKFAVRRSPVDGLFYSLVNPITRLPMVEEVRCGQRNYVKLARSHDLVTWTGVYWWEAGGGERKEGKQAKN